MIRDYPGVELPDWVGSCAATLPNLRQLDLASMPNAVYDVHQLPPNLVILWIYNCPKLKFHSQLRFPSSIKLLSVSSSNDPTLSSVEALPNLSKLQISGFHQQETHSEAPLRKFTCLQDLRIVSCSRLKMVLHVLENLAESLKELHIFWCDDLDCITEKGLQNLSFLRTLEFLGCRGLTSLSDTSSSLRHLTLLTELYLVNCPNMELSAVDFQRLVSLRALTLRELPQMTSMPDAIQHVTTLQYLYIRECKNLMSLTEWLQQHIPHSLHYLQIIECQDELHKRYEVDKGEDWHKISHLQVDIID